MGAGGALTGVGPELCLWEAFVAPDVQHPLCSSCSLPYLPCGWGPQDLVVAAVVEEELAPASSSSGDQPVS